MNTTSQTDPDFISIDDPKVKWPEFTLAMLKTARILLKNDNWRPEITASKFARVMRKHKATIHATYSAWEINDLFSYYGCWLEGGGIQISGERYTEAPHKPRYIFSVTRLIPQEKVEAINGLEKDASIVRTQGTMEPPVDIETNTTNEDDIL
jgi:hypothetical protein